MKNALIATALLITTQCFANRDSIPPIRDTNLTMILLLELQKDASGGGFFEFTQTATGTTLELFTRAKQWVFDTYKAGESVIKAQDKDAGLLIGKGYIGGCTFTNYGKEIEAGGFFYRIELKFKDGKFKCRIDDITYEAGAMQVASGANIADDKPGWGILIGKKKTDQEWGDMKKQGESNLKAVMLSLSDYMTNQSDEKW